MNQVIKFVEENVDGCGTNAEALCVINTDTLLTRGHMLRLQKAIQKIKENTEELWDTDSIITEAMVEVFGESANWDFVYPDLTIEF